MADYKLIARVYPEAASNVSVTSGFAVPGDFSHFMILFPASMNVASACGLQVQGATSLNGTYYTVGWANNPATATSGFKAWDCGYDSPSSIVMCEVLQFVPGFARIKFTSTCTANTALEVWGRKFD